MVLILVLEVDWSRIGSGQRMMNDKPSDGTSQHTQRRRACKEDCALFGGKQNADAYQGRRAATCGTYLANAHN
jgi:hypothetical protein